MSIKKQFLKSKDVYKITWTIDKQYANGAEKISLAGNFNDWDLETDTFEKQKNGSFKLVKELPKDSEYQFRYLLDGEKWLNDETADNYVNNNISNEMNCVITL